MLKLHLDCGGVYFEGWINVDLDAPRVDLAHDLTKPLPQTDQTVQCIYHEHLIEHLSAQQGTSLLKECYRVLAPGGVMRIATPDLDHLIWKYIFGWKKQPWIKKYGYEWLKTRAEMLNLCFHEWGHQYLYNEEELVRRLKEAGFSKIKRQKLNQSPSPELAGRETREDSRLIIEVTK